MNRLPLTFLALFLALGLAAFAMADSHGPGPDAQMLWTHMQKYQSWHQWPEHQGMQPGDAPHGTFHVIYVNAIVKNAEGLPLPNGSIVVKENYSPQKNLVAITVMQKVEGYNPAAGDWYWAKYGPGGEVLAEGKPKGCVGCHSPMADNDYIFLHRF